MDDRKKEKIVKLCSPLELVEYTLVKEALDQAGIECLDTPHFDAAYDDLFVPSSGYADIYVYESNLEEAQKILDSLEKPAPAESQPESEEENEF
ncbi:DUF2007 domain-containing protein [Candidatus Sumerlaeota bacterium]|nr:DUF2007 domain-containing protein [Candidatus Sumerlaeota bacterium]